MIFPSNRGRIFVATDSVDFRKGHNGLAALIQNHLHKDPFTIARQTIANQSAERGALFMCSDQSGLIG